MGQNGDLPKGGNVADGELASIADWYNCVNLDIAALADIVVGTTYAGYDLKRIHNNGSSTVKITFSTVRDPATEIVIDLAAYGDTGRLPLVHTIFKTGTGDDLLLFLQKRL